MLSALFPLLYGTVLVALLWQAFRVMSKGFRAASGPISEPNDRTGRITVHPELLDSNGRVTNEDLLTVRFSGNDDGENDNDDGLWSRRKKKHDGVREATQTSQANKKL